MEEEKLSAMYEKIFKIIILILVPLGIILFPSLYIFAYIFFHTERFITFVICYSLIYIISLIMALDFSSELSQKPHIKYLLFAWAPLINLFIIVVPILFLFEFSFKKVKTAYKSIANWFFTKGNL